MVEGRQKTGISIGSNLIILIFGIVTLTTFAVLSFVSANADSKLAKKSEEAVTAYYKADSVGEELLYKTDTMLKAMAEESENEIQYFEKIAEAFPEHYDSEKQILDFEEQMDEHLRIRIRLKVYYPVSAGTSYEIMSWNTESYDDYIIDDSMPVWTGEELE